MVSIFEQQSFFFLIKVCTFFFRCDGITLLIYYAVSITFVYTGKSKNLYDLLYCDVHFIAVV